MWRHSSTRSCNIPGLSGSMLDLECVGRPPEFRTAVEQLLDADIEASNKSNFLVPVAEIRVVDHIKAALETLQKGLAPP